MSLTPKPARRIDPRAHRLGAGVSALLLVTAFVLDLPWLAVLIGANLLLAASLGTRVFLPGRLWLVVRAVLRPAPVEPEHEYPPRFAQALGGIFLALGAAAFAAGLPAAGWLLAGAVAGLQGLLAATGVCVGCRLYFLHWWVPSLFARLFRRTDGLAFEVPALQRLG